MHSIRKLRSGRVEPPKAKVAEVAPRWFKDGDGYRTPIIGDVVESHRPDLSSPNVYEQLMREHLERQQQVRDRTFLEGRYRAQALDYRRDPYRDLDTSLDIRNDDFLPRDAFLQASAQTAWRRSLVPVQNAIGATANISASVQGFAGAMRSMEQAVSSAAMALNSLGPLGPVIPAEPSEEGEDIAVGSEPSSPNK